MRSRPLAARPCRRARRPCVATVVGLVLAAAALWLAWTAAEQHALLEEATASSALRQRSWALHQAVLATLVLGLSLVAVLWWIGRTQRRTVQRLAEHDDLTGLLNRRALAAQVPRALDRAVRRRTDLALLMIGMDEFKDVNDSLGYDAGDRLLVALTERLTGFVGDVAAVSRLGGDEFALLLPCTGPTQARRTAERLVALLGAPVVLDGVRLAVSASVGVTAVAVGDDFETALRHADVAMHEAKRVGGGRCVEYSPDLDRALTERMELVHDLRRAITGRRLHLVYQPVRELSTGLVVGLEALCRWERDGNPVPPDVFIAVAEENGLITDLGEAVLDLLRSDLPVIAGAVGRRLMIGVNASPQQLRDAAFPHRVREVLAELGPHGLVVEITERDVLDDDPVAQATMASLTEAGVVFAIDDFGVGYSSLSYLQDLPVQILKIDKSFVDRIDEDERACNLLRSIAQLAAALDLEVCVEGLERVTQVQHVLDHVGPLCGQGYGLGRPMALPALVEVLTEQPRAEEHARRPRATLLARGGHA